MSRSPDHDHDHDRVKDCGFHRAHETRLNDHDRRLTKCEASKAEIWKEIDLMRREAVVSRADQSRRISDRVPVRHAMLLAGGLVAAVLSLFGLIYYTQSKMVDTLATIDGRMIRVETILEEREHQNVQFEDIKKQLRLYRQETHDSSGGSNP